MTLRTTLLKLGAAASGLTASVSAFAADTLDKGDTAWMLVATVLVLFMTIPGIALFYAGMARKKNILGTIAQDFAICGVVTGVAYLTTAFCIERSTVKYDLIQCLVFLLDLTIAENRCFVFSIVVTYEFGCSFSQSHPVTGFDGGSVTCTLFLLLHFRVELFDVDCHSVFTKNQFCQV